MQTIQNAIGGKLTPSASTRTQPVFNPATGEPSATLPLSTVAEVDAAVAAARKALPAWANTTPMKRARVMFKFKELLEKHADELAREISREHGKVHDDAEREHRRGSPLQHEAPRRVARAAHRCFSGRLERLRIDHSFRFTSACATSRLSPAIDPVGDKCLGQLRVHD